jgi:hypothetical protein
MIIPTKIILHGDRARCQSVLGVARSRLALLQERLQRSGGRLKQGWQQPLQLSTGETINLAVSFNTSIIEIFAPSYGHEKQAAIITQFKECFCRCDIALGVVVTVPTLPVHGVYFLNVEVCNKDKYLLYENIIASDFTRYVAGQQVLVMAYNDFDFNCEASQFTATGCSPIVNPATTVEDISWRTTYRVIPVCAALIPRWLKDGNM